jgi:hypothetical protein
MLTIKKRQTYLKELGYYTGKVDGKVGPKTKAAYLKLQKDYFTRDKDIDGYYGNDTEKLLISAYNVKKNCKNFRLEEFKCKCKGLCTGYPEELNVHLLKYLQEIRNENGSVNITSGLRCKAHNKAVGGSSTSKHMSGKAVDFNNKKCCASLSTRKATIDKLIKKLYIKYAYCNGYGRTKLKKSYPKANGMGKAIHINV